MKNTILKTFGATALAILMMAIFAQIPVSAQEIKTDESSADSRDDYDNRSLEGVWQTTVTPVNCQTGVPVAPNVSGLITYNDGGTLAETASGAPPSLRSPGHGIWKRNGWRRFTIAFTFLRYTTTGALIGSTLIRQVVQVNGDTGTSSGTLQIIDLNGNVIGSGCSTSTATRFE